MQPSLAPNQVPRYAQLNLFRNQPIVAATTGISETSTSVLFLNEDGTLDSRFGDGGTSVFDWGLYGERVQDQVATKRTKHTKENHDRDCFQRRELPEYDGSLSGFFV